MKIYYINENICKDLTPRFPTLTKEQENKLIRIGINSIFIFEALHGMDLYAYDNISQSVQPLIDVLIDLAEPVSYAYIVKGFFESMSGHTESGKKTIKASVTGYLGIKFIPQIFKIIKSINLG